MVSVLTTAEAMVMIFIDFKGRVPLVVERAAGEAAPIHFQTVIANEVFEVYPVFDVLKDIACHISSLIFEIERSLFIRQAERYSGERTSWLKTFSHKVVQKSAFFGTVFPDFSKVCDFSQIRIILSNANLFHS